MDFYVDVNGATFPKIDGMDKLRRDIEALFEDQSFGVKAILNDCRKDEMKKYLRQYVWDAIPSDLQKEVGYPQVVFNDDNTLTFKFALRLAI